MERINNKEEFHQPGDVEVSYTKNDNMKQNKNKTINSGQYQKSISEEKVTHNKDYESQQKTITEFFISEIRRETDNTGKSGDETEIILSTQEFITDARVRRSLRQRGLEETQKCEQCDYKTKSSALLKQHIGENHQLENEIEIRPRLSCDQCSFKSTSETVLKQHRRLNHSKNGFTNNKKSKRKKCDYCEKQFNKEETYQKHMKSAHGNQVKNNQNELELIEVHS